MSFVIGQRWISESENELGLGIVTEVDSRRVGLFFPAAQERRIYASKGAPLVRILFQVGDIIRHIDGRQGKVLRVEINNEIAFYLVQLPDQEEIIIPEMQLAHHIAFGKPQDRLFSAQIDRSDRFALRYRVLQHQREQFQSSVRGLRGMRAGLIPHQLHIASEVGRRIHPRVLLADEVGLGKTIEAGMILQQQLLSGRTERVLIIVPENLQHQWLVEMLRRFNLHFSLFDEERAMDFDATEEAAERNPFESEALIICALDWLIAQPKRAKQVSEADFDLLIVDEAHHLQWSPQQPSAEYLFIQQLSRRIPSVLLLTATPEQLGAESHFARLHLLDPNRFYDYQAFIDEQRNYSAVAEAVQYLLADQPLTVQAQATLTKLLGRNEAQALNGNSENNDEVQRHAIKQALIKELIDRHGTSRVLFRNTRRGVKGFPQRIYHPIGLPAETDKESRIDWLIDFLKQNRNEKVFVICRAVETVLRLEKILREKEAIRTALFHEGMSLQERDRAAAYFADMLQGAQAMLSSGIGSEGRNFQFSNRLVLFDLPDNPDLLEQCIGRLDRIGQARDVHIYVPYINGSAQQRLAQWYHEGLNAFEETCPMGSLLFEKCGQDLQRFLSQPSETTDFSDFIATTLSQRIELKAVLEQGRDRLLEINSAGGTAAQRLVEHIAAQDGTADLKDFALNLFDVIGMEQDDLDDKSLVIRPTATMALPDFPGLKEEGVTLTFEREFALAREEIEFLTWDHPMIRHGIDLIVAGELGKTAVSLLNNKKLPTGTLLLELIYVVETQAPKALQLTRFLPPTPIRLLLDAKGNDLAPQVSFDKLEKQLGSLDKNMAYKIVKAARAQIEHLLAMAEQTIEERAQSVIEQAKQAAQQTLTAELNRLGALQAVNKNIRQDEIDTLQHILTQSLVCLQQAGWRLDSLRLIVSN